MLRVESSYTTFWTSYSCISRAHKMRLECWVMLGPLQTEDWEPVTITLQPLSLVVKLEPVQVRLTLRSRDQRNMWMQDGCKVCMDSYMASNGSYFMGTWTILQDHLLGPLHTRAKSRDHEVVRAQKKESKGRPNTPPKSCSVVRDPQV